MAGTKEGARKRAERQIKENPNYFSDLAKLAKKPRGGKNSPGSFSKGSIQASKAGRKGGKLSKRGKQKDE